MALIKYNEKCTAKEDAWLIANYGKYKNRALAEKLNRTFGATKMRIATLRQKGDI